MAPESRPRRSALFVPGSNARAIEKARTLPADVLIFDLEDAVAPAQKPAARAAIAAALAQGGSSCASAAMRVNPLGTEWHNDDLVAAAKMPLDALLLPKVESADTVARAARFLDDAGAPTTLALWCMLETPLRVAGASRQQAAEDGARRRWGSAFLAARAWSSSRRTPTHDDAGFEGPRQGRASSAEFVHPKDRQPRLGPAQDQRTTPPCAWGNTPSRAARSRGGRLCASDAITALRGEAPHGYREYLREGRRYPAAQRSTRL